MKIKFLTALLALSALTMTAQQKLFTLEDLNFGGTNYHNLQPKNLWLTWWGDQLVQTDVEECRLVNVKTGKSTLLFTLDDVNQWAKSDDEHYVRHLMNATFPYPGKPVVALGNKRSFLLLDFKKHREFKQRLDEQEQNEEGDIRSFTFHRHDIKGSRDFKGSRDSDGKGGRDFKAKGSRNFRDKGFERGGKRSFDKRKNRFDHDDED